MFTCSTYCSVCICIIHVLVSVQIFKPGDLVDMKDFSTVLVTLQELYYVAAGVCYIYMYMHVHVHVIVHFTIM